MSRKHHKHAAASAPTSKPHEPAGSRAASRKMLYGVIVFAFGAIAVGMYASQSGLTQPNEARAAAGGGQSAGPGRLASMAPSYNFGTVSMAAGNVSHRYTISNLSEAPVTITKVFTSCMCTTATLLTASGRRGPFGMPGHAPIPTIRERLNPGEMAQVDVVFDPTAHGPAGVGRIDRTITLENDAGRPFELAFSANVRP